MTSSLSIHKKSVRFTKRKPLKHGIPARGGKGGTDGKIVRKALDINSFCGLCVFLDPNNIRHQDSKKILRTDKGFQTFRTLFEGVDYNTHCNHILNKFEYVGRIRHGNKI